MSADPSPMGPPPAMGACPKCGQDHDRSHCDGHRRDGRQCGLARGQATKHLGFGNCLHHGGCTKSGEVYADRERERMVLAFVTMMPAAGQTLYAQLIDPETPAAVRRLVAVDILALGGVSARNVLLLGEAPPELLDERRARIAADLERLMAGHVIDTTVAGDDQDDGHEDGEA